MRRNEFLNSIDIVISIYNQESLIERVLGGVIKNTITPFRLILIFDGCTDKTQSVAMSFLKKIKEEKRTGYLTDIVTRVTPNLYETKANNVGFRLVETPYFATIQDDMVIDEYAWEKRLTYPLRRFDDIFAVTSRGAQDVLPGDGSVERYTHTADRQLGHRRNIFAVRDVINRGPVAFRTEYLKKLDFLNEEYAPCNLDDADLCLRAWKQYKWRAGLFWINYISKDSWGKARAKDSTMGVNASNQKNVLRLYSDHKEYLDSGVKHSVDYRIEDRDIANYDNFTPLTQIQRNNPIKKLVVRIINLLGLRGLVIKLITSSRRTFTLIIGKTRQTKPNYVLAHYLDLLESGLVSQEKFTRLVYEFERKPNIALSLRFSIIGTMVWIRRLTKATLKKTVNSMKFIARSIIHEGPIRGLGKIISQPFRELNQQIPRIAFYSTKVARLFYKSPEDIEVIEREKLEWLWNHDNGDKTHRLHYPLNENSLVVDIGGFKGHWASDIFNLYGCNVYIFEPVVSFAMEIKKKFEHNPRVKVRIAGLGVKSGTQKIHLGHGSSSLIRKFNQSVNIEIVDINDFFREIDQSIDLMKINIEGAEYDLLDYLIENGRVKDVKNLQIQFHNFVPNAEERRKKIQQALSRTHHQTYNYDFIWENWSKN